MWLSWVCSSDSVVEPQEEVSISLVCGKSLSLSLGNRCRTMPRKAMKKIVSISSLGSRGPGNVDTSKTSDSMWSLCISRSNSAAPASPEPTLTGATLPPSLIQLEVIQDSVPCTSPAASCQKTRLQAMNVAQRPFPLLQHLPTLMVSLDLTDLTYDPDVPSIPTVFNLCPVEVSRLGSLVGLTSIQSCCIEHTSSSARLSTQTCTTYHSFRTVPSFSRVVRFDVSDCCEDVPSVKFLDFLVVQVIVSLGDSRYFTGGASQLRYY